MKKTFTLFFLLVISTVMNGQVSFDNSCTANLKIVFCDNSQANDAFNEHGNIDLPYLNLLLNENGVKYKGQSLGEIEDLEDDFVKPKTISRTFDVVIGLERRAPMEYFKRLICSLEQLGVLDIDSIYVYFYRQN